MNDLKAVIFDMDGVLIDSMIYWKDKDLDFYGKRGIEVTDDMVRYVTGRSLQEIAEWIKANYALSETVEDLMKEKHAWAEEIYNKLTKPMPGVEKLIASIKNTNKVQAVASGAPRKVVKIVVDRFGWQNYFKVLVSSDDVNFIGKPDPGIFLHTAKKLDLQPEECVVFEDAENGLLAAKQAGMKCIAVLDKRWSFGDFSQADLICKTLEDKRIFKFLNI